MKTYAMTERKGKPRGQRLLISGPRGRRELSEKRAMKSDLIDLSV